ncbi:MAG TPA: glutathione-disulfide reductase [Thermohalobaculum sp.]|nr:glutathione-disulfide reductase [Thermohalobaculum sp.]
MPAFDYDLFVIGGGSGGVRAARVAAAEYGARVAITEEYRYGGTCVIRGCVPKKLMVYASSFPDIFGQAAGFGWQTGEVRHDWAGFTEKRHAEIARLEGAYRDLLAGAGCDVYDQRGVVADPHTVSLADGRSCTARHILIATGGRPHVPDLAGAEHTITSNDVFDLGERPRSVLVIGGGYIAAEFASIFNGLGVVTALAYRGDVLLRGFDLEVRRHVAAEMEKKGVGFHFDAAPERIELVDGNRRVTFADGFVAEAEVVLMATGRRGNIQGLGLEEAGVKLRHGVAVEVDDYSQTAVPSIWAIGDVTARLELTPVAIREGMAFVRTVFGAEPTRFDHDLVPTAVFTQPEIGTIGLTEETARAEHREIDVYCTSFRTMQHAFAGSDERMLMKLIVERAGGRVVGCHIVGLGAGEMIQMLGIAVRMGATKADFDATCAVHPTAAEEIVTLASPVRS